MKKLLTSILCIIFFVQSFAQKHQSFLISNKSKPLKVKLHQKNNLTKNTSHRGTNENHSQLLSKQYFEWDSSESDWLHSEQADYEYDTSGNAITELYTVYDSSSEIWKNSMLSSYTYNNSGNPIEGIERFWNETESSWVIEDKVDITYDTDQNIISEIYSSWNENDGIWIEVDKYDYTYDNGNLVLLLNQERNFENDTWENFERYVVSYNNGLREEAIFQSFDSENANWVNLDKYNYTYNASAPQIIELTSRWDGIDSEWDSIETIDYHFDNNGNPIIELIDYVVNSWPYSKYTYSYDTSISYDTIDGPPIISFDPEYKSEIVNKPLNYLYEQYDNINEVWMNVEKETYVYSDDNTTDISELNKNLLVVYPNPASNFVNFKISSTDIIKANLSVSNLQGQLVLSQPILAQETIDISQIPNGLYVYKLELNQKSVSGKIIISH